MNDNIKILVVDDEEMMRETISAILSDIRGEVDKAADGYKAIELARKNKYNIIFMDIIIEIIDKLYKPVILITDDDFNFRKTLKHSLIEEGYNIELANNRNEAIEEVFGSNSFNAVTYTKNGTYIIAGTLGAIFTSKDGQVWPPPGVCRRF